MRSITKSEQQLIIDSGLFDAGWYAEKYRDVAATGLDPQHHFLHIGIYAGRPPSPLFDGKHYLQQRMHAGHEGLPESPLLDYLEFGWKAGLNPHPLFRTRFYLEKNPDIAESGAEPLGHYLRYGGKEGRNPHPAFDADFYRENNPDVANSGIEPLHHFVMHGLAEGRSPNKFFNVSDYLDLNPDIARAGIHPAIHYACHGFQEGRLTLKSAFSNGNSRSYAEWLLHNDAISKSVRYSMVSQIAGMKNPPTISVVRGVRN
jgi:hypothetical protein